MIAEPEDGSLDRHEFVDILLNSCHEWRMDEKAYHVAAKARTAVARAI